MRVKGRETRIGSMIHQSRSKTKKPSGSGSTGGGWVQSFAKSDLWDGTDEGVELSGQDQNPSSLVRIASVVSNISPPTLMRIRLVMS
jgi:hypothetical protein